MGPENSQIDTSETKNPLFCVTPLSKYLAMVLFIVLPFLGGWVGYVSAPEKEVERVVEKVKEETVYKEIYKEFSNEIDRHYISGSVWVVAESGATAPEFKLLDTDRQVVLDYVSQYFVEQRSVDEQKTELLSFSYGDLSNLYFITGIPDSGGCCRMVRYNIPTKTFFDVEQYHGPIASVVAREYLITGLDGNTLRVHDLKREGTLTEEIVLESGQTLTPSLCHAAPLPYEIHDVIASEDGFRVFYGVYKNVELEDCTTNRPLIEIKELKLDHRQ